MNTAVTFLGIVGFLAAFPAWGADDSECTKLYNLTKSNPGVFAGLGRAATSEGAVDAARVDMAKEISSKVSATTKTKESEKSISLESVVESRVNLVLVGSKVSRRCTHGANQEAVVTLPRDIFVGNLRNMLDSANDKAKDYFMRIKEAKGQSKVTLLVEARKFIDDSAFGETQALCRSFNGCGKNSRNNILSLQTILDDKNNAELVGKASLFSATFENELSEEVGGEVKSLLEQEGITVSRKAAADHVVRIDCSEQLFPKVGENQILELTCRTTGTIEGQKKFSHVYAARGVGNSAREARAVARNQLEKR